MYTENRVLHDRKSAPSAFRENAKNRMDVDGTHVITAGKPLGVQLSC